MRVKTSTSFKLIPEADSAIGNSSGVQQFTAMKARLIIFYARRVFLSRVRHTHPVTPPPYAESFFFKKAPTLWRNKIGGYIVGNNDPAADLVEFGAHPRGGQTLVLKYHPLATGVDIVAAGR